MPSDQDTAPIEGTRDLIEAQLARPNRIRLLLQDFLSAHGYDPLELPILERTSLYLRKLGSRVAGSMFNLSDQRGERLSLRPELTASAIRAFMDRRDALSLPVRWQYCGPVFRDQEEGGRLRQFTQLGAELIGSAAPRADAELLAIACSGLRAAGLPRPHLVLGHAGLIPSLVEQMPVSERARTFLVGHLDRLRRGPEGLAELRRGLEERRLLAGSPQEPHILLGAAESEEATNLVGWLLSEGATRSTGRRSTDQIVRRFRTKLQGPDDPEQLDRALALAGELAQVRDAPHPALDRGRAIVAGYGLAPGPLSDLERIIGLLEAYGEASVEMDLGLTRAMGYYTGIVFEVYADRAMASSPIAGGGRYDGLVRALGGAEDTPALGFAYALEELEGVLPAPREQEPGAARVLVVPEDNGAMPEVVRYMEELRAAGQRCVLEVLDRTDAERLSYCRRAGVTRMVTVGPGGLRETLVGEGSEAYAPAGAS